MATPLQNSAKHLRNISLLAGRAAESNAALALAGGSEAAKIALELAEIRVSRQFRRLRPIPLALEKMSDPWSAMTGNVVAFGTIMSGRFAVVGVNAALAVGTKIVTGLRKVVLRR